MRHAKNRLILGCGAKCASVNKRDSTKYQNPDPLPMRLRGLNRVAMVVSCLCGLGLIAILLFAMSRTQETSYTDYTPPAGLRFANERPSKEPSADNAFEKDKAKPTRSARQQSGTSQWQSPPSSVSSQPKPRMLFQDPLEQTKLQADPSPDAKSSGTLPSKDAGNVRSEPAAVSLGEERASSNPVPRLFRVPSPRMVVADKAER